MATATASGARHDCGTTVQFLCTRPAPEVAWSFDRGAVTGPRKKKWAGGISRRESVKVLLFGGSGTFGQDTARWLASSDLISEIALAGRNRNRLRSGASEVGKKAHVVSLDLRDEDHVAALARDYDIMVNVAAPEWEALLPGLRAAIAAGVPYCDVGADGQTAESQLSLDTAAKEKGIVAAIGIGTDPGLDNLMAVHASRMFDKVEDVQIQFALFLPAWFPDPPKALEELRARGKADASWELFPYLASKRARIYRDGQWIDVSPREHPVAMTVPDGPTLTAFPLDVPEPRTLPRHLAGVRNVSAVISVIPAQVGELMFREGSRIREGLSPSEATKSVMETVLTDPDRWLRTSTTLPSGWNFWVATTGWKDDQRMRYMCWPEGLPDSTTVALAVATLKILRGEVEARGVLPPEACFEPSSFFGEVARYAGEVERDKPLLGERFERLE